MVANVSKVVVSIGMLMVNLGKFVNFSMIGGAFKQVCGNKFEQVCGGDV